MHQQQNRTSGREAPNLVVNSWSNEQEAAVMTVQNAPSDNFYAVLQIDPKASFKTIKKAYLKFALLCHPDKNTHPKAGEATKRLNNAYDTLKDSNKKLKYDLSLSQSHNSYEGYGGYTDQAQPQSHSSYERYGSYSDHAQPQSHSSYERYGSYSDQPQPQSHGSYKGYGNYWDRIRQQQTQDFYKSSHGYNSRAPQHNQPCFERYHIPSHFERVQQEREWAFERYRDRAARQERQSSFERYHDYNDQSQPHTQSNFSGQCEDRPPSEKQSCFFERNDDLEFQRHSQNKSSSTEKYPENNMQTQSQSGSSSSEKRHENNEHIQPQNESSPERYRDNKVQPQSQTENSSELYRDNDEQVAARNRHYKLKLDIVLQTFLSPCYTYMCVLVVLSILIATCVLVMFTLCTPQHSLDQNQYYSQPRHSKRLKIQYFTTKNYKPEEDRVYWTDYKVEQIYLNKIESKCWAELKLKELKTYIAFVKRDSHLMNIASEWKTHSCTEIVHFFAVLQEQFNSLINYEDNSKSVFPYPFKRMVWPISYSFERTDYYNQTRMTNKLSIPYFTHKDFQKCNGYNVLRAAHEIEQTYLKESHATCWHELSVRYTQPSIGLKYGWNFMESAMNTKMNACMKIIELFPNLKREYFRLLDEYGEDY